MNGWQTIAWTLSSIGWCFMAMVYDSVPMLFVAFACFGVACLWPTK